MDRPILEQNFHWCRVLVPLACHSAAKRRNLRLGGTDTPSGTRLRDCYEVLHQVRDFARGCFCGQHGRMGNKGNKGKVGYPSDVTDEEWEFVLPYLLLSCEDSAHREHGCSSTASHEAGCGIRRQNRFIKGIWSSKCSIRQTGTRHILLSLISSTSSGRRIAISPLA